MNTDKNPNAQALEGTNVQALEHTSARAPQHDQPTLDLEDATNQHLIEPQLLKRYSTNVISPSLLASNPEAYSELCESLSRCADNITVKKDGALYYHRRCKHRICSLCESIRVTRERAKMRAIIDALPALIEDGGDHIAITLTLNAGTRVNRLELRDTVKALHHAWSRLVQTSRLKRHLAGYHRATETTVEYHDVGEPSFHPHIHCTMLVDAKDCTLADAIILVRSAVKRSWLRLVRSEARKLGLEPDINLSAQLVKPLDSQTEEDFERWLSYCVKGVVEPIARQFVSARSEPSTRQVAETWSTLHTELPHQRLSSLGGLMRSALSDIKRERDIERAEIRERARLASGAPRNISALSAPHVTHKWSYPEGRWIHVNEWREHHGRISGYTQRALLLHTSPEEISIHLESAHYLTTTAAISKSERVRDIERAYWLATGKPLPFNTKLSIS